MTKEEAKTMLSVRGSYSFRDDDRQAALAAAWELLAEGHAVTSASVHATNETQQHDLQVAHFLSCKKCAG